MSSEAGDRRPQKPLAAEQEQLPCPRCDSPNTKFCYYNNYNFAQPRYFCKSCRRYWTHGGTLRDIPVGGATRKGVKRPRSVGTSSATTASTTTSSAFSTAASGPILNFLGARSDAVYGATAAPFVGCEVIKSSNVGSACGGSFTTLLNNAAGQAHVPSFLALSGFGLGGEFDEMGFGVGRGVWAFPAAGDLSGGAAGGGISGVNTWQLESGEAGGYAGGGECFSWPELAISTPGNVLK